MRLSSKPQHRDSTADKYILDMVDHTIVIPRLRDHFGITATSLARFEL